MNEVEKIISSARDKYAVHECGECTYRKCCDLNSNGFGSAECLSRRASISLMLGIEDSCFTKILDDIEAAWNRERASVGNSAALREAVVKALTLLHVCDWPPGISLVGVADVIHEIDSALDKPPRNCDVGTINEQRRRFENFCRGESCEKCPCKIMSPCSVVWGQLPYSEEGGAGK